MLDAFGPTASIETGCYIGKTTNWLFVNGYCPVYATDFMPAHYDVAVENLAGMHIELNLGDSRDYLRQIALRKDVPNESVFFYLDAHWTWDLPLREELQLINEHWRKSVIMIDDFKVEDDKDYRYDTWPQGTLSLATFNDVILGDVYFPSCPGIEEQEPRCGCVVIAQEGVDLRSVKELRAYIR